VSTDDLQAVLQKADPVCAASVIEEVMNGGMAYLADIVEDVQKMHGIKEEETTSELKVRVDAAMRKRKQNFTKDRISDIDFVKLLMQESNVASSVRDSVSSTFHQKLGFTPLATGDSSEPKQCNQQHPHCQHHVAVDVGATMLDRESIPVRTIPACTQKCAMLNCKAERNADVNMKTSCCESCWARLKLLRKPAAGVWLLLAAAFVGRLFQFQYRESASEAGVIVGNGGSYDDDESNAMALVRGVESTKNNWAVAVAKGAGFAILVATCFIYLSKHPLFAWIRIAPSFWDNTPVHAHFGVGLFVFTIIHVCAHFSWQGMGAFTTDTSNSTTDVSTHYNLCAAWLTATGLVMTLIIVAITLTATRRRQHMTSYRSFLKVHYLYYLYLPVLIMHVPYRMYVLGVVLALFIVHECMKMRVTVSGNLKECGIVGASTTRVVMDNADLKWSLLGSIPGAFYKVKVPSLGLLEWHPFSLATSRSGLQPEFFVESLGTWTRQLQKVVSTTSPSERENIEMHFQGPFYAPAVNVVEQRRPVCIAAGIGITPFIGIIHHYVARHAAKKIEKAKNEMLTNRSVHMLRKQTLQRRSSVDGSNADKLQQNVVGAADVSTRSNQDELCTIIWVVRDLTLANFLLPYVDDLLELQDGGDPLVRLKIYFTGTSGGSTINSMAYNALLLYHFGQSSQADDKGMLEIHLGRPDMQQELGADANPTAAFYCGGPGLKTRLENVCGSLNLPFHPEEFQNRTLSEWRF
jgi:hypothetical protein